jgi:hypothetical protein
MMKKVSLLLLIALLYLPCTAKAAIPDAAVYVDTDTVLVRDLMGAGVQWDPSDLWDYSDSQWKMIEKRVDFLQPPFIRCCLMAAFYCNGFDADGKPVYDWNSLRMKRLYRILDYCQSRHVDVLLGEWGASFGMKWDDPRWARLISDCLEYLIRKRGYTCIKYYNMINEPRGDYETFLIWKKAQANLKIALDKDGLGKQVILVGPDYSGGNAAIKWVDYITKMAANIIGAYETHWYASSKTEIPQGVIEDTMRKAREMVSKQDPNGKKKRIFFGESGTGEWLNGDNNRYIRDYVYGVFMSDYFAQTLRAGLDGQSAWDLDDSMHQQPGCGTADGLPSGEKAKDDNLKTWGFWNTMGAAMGHPEDENLRPWFYTWSLISRCFPRGSQSLEVTNTGLPGVRVAAALVTQGKRKNLSLLVVNDIPMPNTVRIIIPNGDKATFKQYNYFENDRPVDANGFPIAKTMLYNVNIGGGFNVHLPSRGVVILSTLDGGSLAPVGYGAHIPVESVRILRDNEYLQVGHSMQMIAATDPPGRYVIWSVTGMDGAPAESAWISRKGVLTARKPGHVMVIAEASESSLLPVRDTIEVDITRDRLLVDNLNDWSKIDSHTDGWAFDTLNNNLFEGDPSRLKRTEDTPQSIVYHFDHLSNFTARLYYSKELDNCVRFYTSSDKKQWTEIHFLHDAPIPTGGPFKRTNIRPANIPAGTNYLKIEFSNDDLIYSPQLGRIELIQSQFNKQE